MAKKSNKTMAATISDVKGVVQFEPCAAPLTTGRSIRPDEDKPTYSLRHDDGRVFVYGVKDCADHSEGKPRRLNSFERYTDGRDTDYVDLLKVQWLHLFASHRGSSEQIAPTGVISVPISVFNNEESVTAVKAKIAGAYSIEDSDGCQLRIRIDEKRLIVLPESVGALYHFVYDAETRKPRGGDYDASGNVLVVDIGFLTTDFSLHIDMKYQRQKEVSFTEPNMGMGIISQQIRDGLNAGGYDFDLSEIDAALRTIAGQDIGATKNIVIAGRHIVPVESVYDPGIRDLAKAIADTIRNRYKIPISLIVLSGGGAYHLHRLLSNLLNIPVMMCPNAAISNVLGAFTRLCNEAAAKGAIAPLLYAVDNGNGTSKGVSVETWQK